MTSIFLHGLESSSEGTKARWFRHHFPDMLVPDFVGTLEERMADLQGILSEKENIVIVGSSFGGLMATIYALKNERRVLKVVLLAPALNFKEFEDYRGLATRVTAHLYVGRRDAVCPPEIVIPAALEAYKNITVHETDDDHLLKNTFSAIEWHKLLSV